MGRIEYTAPNLTVGLQLIKIRNRSQRHRGDPNNRGIQKSASLGVAPRHETPQPKGRGVVFGSAIAAYAKADNVEKTERAAINAKGVIANASQRVGHMDASRAEGAACGGTRQGGAGGTREAQSD